MTATARTLNVDVAGVFARAKDWAQTQELPSDHRPTDGVDYHARYLESLARRNGPPEIHAHVRLYAALILNIKLAKKTQHIAPVIAKGGPPDDEPPAGRRNHPPRYVNVAAALRA